MPRLNWSRKALLDLVRLHAFLDAWNPDVARRAIQGIRKGVRVLEKHPEIGRPVEDVRPGIREWVIEFGNGAYVVRYEFDHKKIILMAIRHGREDGY